MSFRRFLAVSSLLALVAGSAEASITINLSGGTFYTQTTGTPVAEGTLFQLINLGPDGVFNPISLFDGDTSANGQWVSGDDTLITAITVGGDYAGSGGFDLGPGTGNHQGLVGFMDRVLSVNTASVLTGTKVGIRWFPSFTAANYDSLPGGLHLAGGERYGQFTRQANPLYGGTVWSIGDQTSGATVTFDPLGTTDIGGTDPNSAATASFIVPTPEPATLSLAFLGAMGLISLRRRRS